MTPDEVLKANAVCGTHLWNMVLPTGSLKKFYRVMAISGMGEVKVPAFAKSALGGTCFYFRNASDNGLFLEIPMTTAQYKI